MSWCWHNELLNAVSQFGPQLQLHMTLSIFLSRKPQKHELVRLVPFENYRAEAVRFTATCNYLQPPLLIVARNVRSGRALRFWSSEPQLLLLGHPGPFLFMYMCSSHTCSISALITDNHSTLHHLNQLSTGGLQHAGEPRSHTWMKKIYKIRPLYYIVLWCRVRMCWEGAVPLIGFGIWQKWIDSVNSALQIQIGVAQPNWSLFILAETYTKSLWSINGIQWIFTRVSSFLLTILDLEASTDPHEDPPPGLQ